MGIDDLTGGIPRSSRPLACRGEVAVPPANDASPMTVILVNYSRALAYEIPATNWMPRAALPVAGSSCLVVFDDDGDAWVPVWGTM